MDPPWWTQDAPLFAGAVCTRRTTDRLRYWLGRRRGRGGVGLGAMSARPPPRRFHDADDGLLFGAPVHHFADPVRGGHEHRRIAVSPGPDHSRHRSAGDTGGGVDHLAHRIAGARSDVEGVVLDFMAVE